MKYSLVFLVLAACVADPESPPPVEGDLVIGDTRAVQVSPTGDEPDPDACDLWTDGTCPDQVCRLFVGEVQCTDSFGDATICDEIPVFDPRFCPFGTIPVRLPNGPGGELRARCETYCDVEHPCVVGSCTDHPTYEIGYCEGSCS